MPCPLWTADSVGRRLPDHPVMTRGRAFTEEDGAAVEPFGWPERFVAELRDRRMLMTWASCMASGESATERYRYLGWERSTVERRRRAALAMIAAGLARDTGPEARS